MDNRLFLLLHVTSVILLSGVTFAAFAAPQSENRRPSLMVGICPCRAILYARFRLIPSSLPTPGTV